MYYRIVNEIYIDTDINVEGLPVHAEVDLDSYSSMIGTNYNDVNRSVSYIHYGSEDEAWVEELVYESPRDWRIIVWEGSEVVNLEYDDYRIVSLRDFNIIKSDIHIGHTTEGVFSRPLGCRDTFDRRPLYTLRTNRFKTSGASLMRANEKVESLIDEFGHKIKYRPLRDRYTDYCVSINTRPRKSWKVDNKERQWIK